MCIGIIAEQSNCFEETLLIFDYNDDHYQEFEITGNRCIGHALGWHNNYQPDLPIYYNGMRWAEFRIGFRLWIFNLSLLEVIVWGVSENDVQYNQHAT